MPTAASDNAPQGGATGQTGTWTDPYRAYNFKLEIQGVTEGHFTECSGLNVRVQAIPYREAGTGQIVHYLPGRVEYGQVTLRYGLTASTQLWDWLMNVARGQVERRNVSILMIGEDGSTPVLQWNLLSAWPSAWQGALLDALGQEAAIESISLVFESLERA
jgi:phage tail-like protein